ncbi:MAG: hypothetical protein LC620_02940 [Halobacteriales archaeon]|nr:hypothetical protein [Halobacteriales archaeon]
MRALLLVLLTVPVLAGCLGQGTPADVQPLATDQPGANPAQAPVSGQLANGTLAGNVSGAAGGLVAAAQQWTSDLWKGQDKLTLIEDTRPTANYPGVRGLAECLWNCYDAFFVPKKGAFVPPGASTVEVTATWTVPATAPAVAMDFAYRTAGDADPVAGTIESNKPLTITVGPKDADAPFAPWSQWWFDLFPHADPAGAATDFDVKLLVVVHKGPDAPAFDPPKDPWNGGAIIPLSKFSADETTFTTPQTFSCPGNCRWGFDSKGPGLVADGASKVVVTIAWTWSGPTKVVLFAFPPGADQPVPFTVAKDGDTSRTFEIQPPAGSFDSPFQQRSGWFLLARPDGGTLPVGAAQGTMTLEAQAVKGA